MSESSDDIHLINAKVEPAIADLSPSVPYPVKSGAESIVWESRNANSLTTTNMVFNINTTPQYIIDREMRVRAKIKARVTITKESDDDNGKDIKFLFGETDALRPFPLNQTVNNCSVSLGTQTITLPQRDIFDLLLKCTPKKFLSRYNSTCPSYIDSSYKNYKDRSGTLNDPLQGYEDALLSDMVPNGAFPIEITHFQQYNGNTAIAAPGGQSRQWHDDATKATAIVTFDTDEPLFVSPLIFTGDMNQNKSGILGINTFTVRLDMTGNPNHMFCTSSGEKVYDELTISDAQLHYKTYTGSNSDSLPIKSVIPYKVINFSSTGTNAAAIAAKGTTRIGSPVIEWGTVPDYFIVAVRKIRRDQTLYDASSAFFPIKHVNVSFNHNKNLLSSLTPEDLWRLSVKNGSTQSFYEFRGTANIGTNSTGISGTNVATVGSLLIVSATDLNLPAQMAPGTAGNISFKFDVEFTNNDDETVNPELVVMYVCNSIVTVMNGNTQITNSLLTVGGNVKVLNEAPVKIVSELMYPKGTERTGGNLSGLLASKIQKALSGRSGSGVKSGAGVISGSGVKVDRSSLFY